MDIDISNLMYNLPFEFKILILGMTVMMFVCLLAVLPDREKN